MKETQGRGPAVQKCEKPVDLKKILQNEHLFSKIGINTAENEPSMFFLIFSNRPSSFSFFSVFSFLLYVFFFSRASDE